MNVLYIRDASGKFIPVPTISGKDGKSAYQYAQDGGYTGTEAEFAVKLAEEVYSKAETDAAISAAFGDGMPEVIEEIILPDAVASVLRDETPEGEKYKYKKIAITIMNTGTKDVVGKWTQLKVTTDDDKTAEPFRIKEGGETEIGNQRLFADINDGYLSVKISGTTTNEINLVIPNVVREYRTTVGDRGVKRYIKKIEIVKEVGFSANDVIIIEGVRA